MVSGGNTIRRHRRGAKVCTLRHRLHLAHWTHFCGSSSGLSAGRLPGRRAAYPCTSPASCSVLSIRKLSRAVAFACCIFTKMLQPGEAVDHP